MIESKPVRYNGSEPGGIRDMKKFIKFTALLTCGMLSLQLISCTSKPVATESSETTNVFEATTTESAEITETTAITETSQTTTETSETTTAAMTTESTAATTESSETSSSSSASETSATSETSQLSNNVCAVYTKIPEEKKNYIIYNETFGGTITANAMNKGYIGITIVSDGTNLTGDMPAEALQFTLFYDERQNFTLRDLDGRFLSATSQGDLILTDQPVEDNYQFWRMEETKDGWHIINVGAANNQALQYSSGTFSIRTCANTSAFVFNFYEVG